VVLEIFAHFSELPPQKQVPNPVFSGLLKQFNLSHDFDLLMEKQQKNDNLIFFYEIPVLLWCCIQKKILNFA